MALDYDMATAPQSSKLRVAELLDPVGFSVKLLEGMIKFWKRFAPFIESSGNFSDKEIPKLQEKLLRVEKYMDKL